MYLWILVISPRHNVSFKSITLNDHAWASAFLQNSIDVQIRETWLLYTDYSLGYKSKPNNELTTSEATWYSK